jgi:copper transport protein
MKRIGLIALLLLVVLALPGVVSAHATLLRSDPPANSVAPKAPGSVRLTFSEAADPGFSRIEVYDANGRRVDQSDSHLDPTDALTLIVGLSGPLPDGIYTVSWRALSAVDGHVTQGSFAFGTGQVDMSTAPAASQQGTVPLDLLAGESFARWLNLLAAMLVAGGPLFRLLVWRPAWRDAFGTDDQAPLKDTRIARGALALLLVALLAVLYVQAVAVGGGPLAGGVDPAQLVRLVTDSRFGAVWLARLTLAFALMLTLRAGYDRRVEIARLALAALLLFTSALVSHAAGQPDPLLPLLNDVVHLLAAAAWGGSLVYLLISLRDAYATLEPPARTRLAAAAVPRFSALGLTAVSLLVLTGVVQTILQVSGTDFAPLFAADSPLLTTDYGRALLIKLVLILPLVGTAAVNLLIVSPRLRAALRAGNDDAAARKLLARSVPVEIALLGAVLLVVGALTSLQPVRQPGVDGLILTGKANDLNARLVITPGRVGINDFAVTLTDAQGAPYDRAKSVTLRLQLLSTASLGSASAELAPAGGGRYTAQGPYLSLGGRWAFELAVRRPDAFDSYAQFQADVSATGAQAGATEGQAIRWPLVTGALIVALALLAGALLWRSAPRRARLVAAPLVALVLVVPGALTIDQGLQIPRSEIRNPLAGDPAAIAAGGKIYPQRCLVCHGVDGRGNGPAAITLNPRPADFCIHMQPGVHSDADIFDWISDGYPNSAMPTFRTVLSETERWEVYAYLKATFGKPDCSQPGLPTPVPTPGATP